MNFLVGARGRLGQALMRAHPAGEVHALDRLDYEDWWKPGSVERIRARFREAEPGSVVYVTSGLLDPKAPAEEHQRLNVRLPINLVEALDALGLKVVTFGTVMEGLMAHPNRYVASKAQLGNFAATAGPNVLHVRIHTLYGGGAPAPFMFLGQMLDALRSALPFRMTSGTQLREYHHVDDDAFAIGRLAAAGRHSVVDLSHGHPVMLSDLAAAIFAKAGASDLLQVGTLPEPAEENYGAIFQPTAGLETLRFREPIAGVVEYLLPFVTRH